MRIISQDGNIDVPYEQVSVERMGASIWCGYNATLEKSCTGRRFAEYSRQEKAEKAMEMLRQAYTGRYITNANVSEDFDETMQELMKHGFGTVIVRDGYDSRVEFDNLNGYFKFPDDEEIEV